MPKLLSTADVIEALGGVAAVRELTGRGETAPYNWRNHAKFPANTYLVMVQALAARGLHAPAWLWNQGPPPARATKADASEVA
jgi:hypothetical protein